MAQKSKKSKSKRVTLKQKYKVIRKVKEHTRKVAKAARKSGKKPKPPADPGIPKQWPFKQELIQELDEKKRLILEAEAARKAANKRAREAAASQPDEDMQEAPDLEALQAEVDQKQQAYAEQKRAKKEAAGTPQERSRRAFYKEFVKVVQAADVIVEVLDARDPLAYRATEVEAFIRSADPNKKIVLLLNKIDLVPREVAERWLKHFRRELPTVAFKCSTQKQAQNLSQRRTVPGGKGRKARASGSGGTADYLQGSDCLGADTLLQLLKNYTRNAGIKTAITIGIIGLPNVGKSSLINSLKRTRVAAVGNAPGVTTSVQEVHLDKNIKLLDSPGIVFSAAANPAASALRNCIKIEQLEDPALPVSEIVAKCPPQQLMRIYKIPAFSGTDQFLQLVAAARGKLQKGGTVDMVAAARAVLSDWNDGRIPYFTEPPAPQTDSHASADIVNDWAASFNANEVFAQEQSAVLAGLLSQDSSSHFVQESAGQAAVDMEALQPQAEPGHATDGSAAASAPEASSADAMDDTDGPPQPRSSQHPTGPSQTEVLYNSAGQFNPHAARSQKKQAKRQKKAVQQPAGDGSGSDFDWDEET